MDHLVKLLTPPTQPAGPLCYKCGWSKFGMDSWDGVNCRCNAPKHTTTTKRKRA